ncbi:hypothetical protein PP747_gp026 [Rhizobium phage RHph_Y38]|uniref:Uncharacterized protein n=1 Tax=Rhizobium phage RHph_Y38 TaxID=2509781 RepID=A0A7S5QX55_9CAUD|nr:hypothetical protein PP747_gp026 [Rhizobium phage RHph_Y38]QIG67727.1 hypothetical protein EVB52_026 [Rhizobium phage RHph_Y38]
MSNEITATVSITVFTDKNNHSSTDLVLSHDDILYLCDRDTRSGKIYDSSELFENSTSKIDGLIYALQQMKSFAP